MRERLYKDQSDGKRMIADVLLWFTALSLGLFFGSTCANAQMTKEPWGFQQQNRASIAALMQQVENRNNTTAVASTGYAGYDQLVCGGGGSGGGESTATANSTCIILNNSDGSIQIGQDAQGNQDASSAANTTLNELSDVLGTIDNGLE